MIRLSWIMICAWSEMFSCVVCEPPMKKSFVVIIEFRFCRFMIAFAGAVVKRDWAGSSVLHLRQGLVYTPPMVMLFAFRVALFLMLSVAWPSWPILRAFVIVHFEFVSCMLTVPLEPALLPMMPSWLLSWMPFLMLSMPVASCPTPSVLLFSERSVLCVMFWLVLFSVCENWRSLGFWRVSVWS